MRDARHAHVINITRSRPESVTLFPTTTVPVDPANRKQALWCMFHTICL
jgi:hypothetical protein